MSRKIIWHNIYLAYQQKVMTMNISIPGVYMVCGLQGGGKSHLIKYIMHENRKKFDFGIVFTNTGFVDANFDYVDERFVHLEYDSEILKNFKDICKRRIEASQTNKNVKPLCGFVIFDDCLEGNQWKDKELRSLVTQVRHYNITVIISTQHPTAIPPLFRTNTWQAFMFFMGTEDAMKALHKNYGQMVGTFADFKEYFTEATAEKHQFVAYDSKNGGTDVATRYKVLICPSEIPNFRVGKLLKRAK